MKQRGFTLIEALMAMAILGIAMASLIPAFLFYADSNTRNETRSGAVAAAQVVMENWRLADPAALPDTGSSGPDTIQVGDHSYDVTTHFCVNSSLCGAGSRHLVVEVSHESEVLYSTETVYTQLR